ncbi:uncharacterized protein A4U43_C05F7800 [Asparagus officinalis]|uniref:Uncharacterized protein n=1 Tax=Asparagus officinalis TaxID=4686 RepID=A0A5P1EQP8_ASPOF|nr:uncharacterized protein A4U43_C05F7800 [Asparagus officinalis]
MGIPLTQYALDLFPLLNPHLHLLSLLEEGVYERLRNLERRQEEINAEMVGTIDGFEQKLDDIPCLLQLSTPSSGP